MRSLDPADISDTTSSLVASQIFEPLYQYHYLNRPYELVSLLADSAPRFSSDGLACTIKIKKGIFFADDPCFKNGIGRELKASDFIFAWKRIADIKNLSANWWIFQDRIVGLDEFRDYTARCLSSADVDYSRNIEGLQALDDYTIRIGLKKPWPRITYFLARLALSPVAEEAVDYYGQEISNHPVGTGPYRLKKLNRDSYIELVKNPRFREELYPAEGPQADTQAGLLTDAGKKLPLTEKIIFTVVQEDQPRWFLFMQGKIDLIVIPKDNFSEAVDSNGVLRAQLERKNVHLAVFKDPSTFWIGFNMLDKLLGVNKPLRQALSYAIDRDKYIRLFHNNAADTAYGIIPPLLQLDLVSSVQVHPAQYDLQKAKLLLSQAKQLYGSSLPRLTLSIPGTSATFRQEGEFFRHCFKNVGLDVDIDYLDWPAFQEKLRNHQLQMFSLGWIGQYPDAENFLQLFYSNNISGGLNSFNYANPEFDKLYEQIKIMTDCTLRDSLCQKAQEIVLQDCPFILLRHGVAVVLYHDWLCNYKPHAFGYGLSKYRRIDDGKRAAFKSFLDDKP